MSSRRVLQPARRGLFAAALLAALGARAAARRAPAHRIAILLSDLRNPFFATIARSFEQRLRALDPGDGPLDVLSAGFDPERQAQQLAAQLRAAVDLVVVTPIDARSLGPHVAEVRRAGMRVIAVDSRVEGADLVITTDNAAAAEMACDELVAQLHGQGRIAIVDGPPNSADIDRLQGCDRVLRRHPGIAVVARTSNAGGSREGGLERMVAVMAANPRIDGVFAINDLTALGVEQAAREAGRDEMIVTSVDGSPAVVERLKDARSLIAASASQDPARMGVLAAQGAAALLRGEAPARPQLLLKPTLVTRANVARYRGW
ncbi:MAG: substrate-binding domain-containing protein [Burkholderiaceae bacterium]